MLPSNIPMKPIFIGVQHLPCWLPFVVHQQQQKLLVQPPLLFVQGLNNHLLVGKHVVPCHKCMFPNQATNFYCSMGFLIQPSTPHLMNLVPLDPPYYKTRLPSIEYGWFLTFATIHNLPPLHFVHGQCTCFNA